MNLEEKVKQLNGFSEFNPMQKEALGKDLNKSLVVSSPTASGKTIIAELFSLNSILNNKKKVVYTCPLRALASEHFKDFKKKYSKELGVRIGISTGDFDSSSSYLSSFDLIFLTYEKLDSLLRHKADWLQQIGLLIVDELHELDSGRGPTLELVITKLRAVNPGLQVLSLSATIPNAKDLSQWLGAELIESSFRPTVLREGVFFNNSIDFDDEIEEVEAKADALLSLTNNVLLKQKQALIFANTRKRSQTIAKKLASLVASTLNAKEKTALLTASEKALSVLEQPTEQCKNVSELLKKGVCFHNAGLMLKQREIIEDCFRQGLLKTVVATPTLAAGINLPAHTVVIHSLYRYTSFGNQRISVREYKQMAGRAGRPKFDSFGRSVVLAHSEFEAEELFESYINGEVEEVNSRLASEPVLRTHLLSAIAADFVFDLASLEEFFSRTFYAFQFRDLKHLFLKLNNILLELEEMGFIECNEKRFKATILGRRVSELYLDPISAFELINALKQKKSKDLFYLFSLVNCGEFFPWFSVPSSKEALLWEELQEKELPVDAEKEMFADPELVKKFNSALLLETWINEIAEQEIVKEFNVQPGLLQSKLRIIDWLAYAAFELSRLLKLENHLAPLNKLRRRLKYGVKEELVLLTELKFIGRVRARKLFRAGIKSISEVKKAELERLSVILPPAIALKVKQQLGCPNYSKELLEQKQLT